MLIINLKFYMLNCRAYNVLWTKRGQKRNLVKGLVGGTGKATPQRGCGNARRLNPAPQGINDFLWAV